MSDYSQAFIAYLANLQERDRRPFAELRRSLSFAPGSYPPAYPYVERFVGHQDHALDSSRLALYLVAGLYASHPELSDKSLAHALGQLLRLRESESIEKRFIALLSADSENVYYYLRQIVSLLAAEGLGVNYASLLDDLRVWLNPHLVERRDQIRQRWARDFYRALEFHPNHQSQQLRDYRRSMMSLFLEFHLIQNFAPSNLNRDDLPLSRSRNWPLTKQDSQPPMPIRATPEDTWT